MKRLNANIDAENMVLLERVLDGYGLKSSEALRVGLNLFSAALPILASGGSIIFRQTDQPDRTYAVPLSDEMVWRSESPRTGKEGQRRLTGQVPTAVFATLKHVFDRFGLSMSDGMRQGLYLFAAALPTLAAGGKIVFRDAGGEEKSYSFPFIAVPVAV